MALKCFGATPKSLGIILKSLGMAPRSLRSDSELLRMTLKDSGAALKWFGATPRRGGGAKIELLLARSGEVSGRTVSPSDGRISAGAVKGNGSNH